MWRQLPDAAGYLSIFIVPVLLVLGIAIDTPSLAFGVVMLVSPLLRPVFGSVSRRVVWSEPIATALDRLPLGYAVVLPAIVGMVLHDLSLHGIGSLAYAAGLGLSLWMTLLFSTCVSHELIHRRGMLEVSGGHVLAGIAGYPVLAQEHFAHHARPGDTASAAWPHADESVWGFAWRRCTRIFSDAYGPDSALWDMRTPGRSVLLLRLGTAVSVVTAAAFWWAAGWRGFVLYACVATGVWFGVQLITYIQHWGLGDDRLGERALQGYGWEDNCRLQAWITLSISLHSRHHQQCRLPYYRVSLTPDSPRLPAGYVVLMVLCLFPGLWFRSMKPVLEHWEEHPATPLSPGRRLTCFFAYSPRESALNR